MDTDLIEFGQVSGHDGQVGRRLPHVLDSLNEEAINHLEPHLKQRDVLLPIYLTLQS